MAQQASRAMPLATSSGASAVPFLEQFVDSVILVIRLKDADRVLASVDPDALVHYVHKVYTAIEPIVEKFGLSKANVLEQGLLHAFCITPEMPPGVQSIKATLAAKELRLALWQVPTPQGVFGLWDVALHAGNFTGAVLGKSTWAYMLYGGAVQEAFHILRSCPETGVLKCSGEFLAIVLDKDNWKALSSLELLYRPERLHVYKYLDILKPQDAAAAPPGEAAATAAPVSAPPAPPGSRLLLSFSRRELEREFQQYHDEVLAQWDRLVLLLALAATLLHLLPGLPSVYNFCVPPPLHFLFVPLLWAAAQPLGLAPAPGQRELLMLLQRLVAIAYATVPGAACMRGCGEMGLLRHAPACFHALMFKVRFKQQLLLSALSAAMLLLPSALRHVFPAFTTSAMLASSPSAHALAAELALAAALPALLTYALEAFSRRRFVRSLEQANKKAA